jgi:hypothetical protein
MPQYWLKPLGTTQPKPDPGRDDWASERGLENFELTTGPATIKSHLRWAAVTAFCCTR